MLRCFFDIHDSSATRDDTGTACAVLDEVRMRAIRTVPDVAREDIPEAGDRRTFGVLATDEDGRPAQPATLDVTGTWPRRRRPRLTGEG